MKLTDKSLRDILDRASECFDYLNTEWSSDGVDIRDSAGGTVARTTSRHVAGLLSIAPELAAEVLRLRKDLRSACKTLQVAGYDKGYAIADRMRAKGKVAK